MAETLVEDMPAAQDSGDLVRGEEPEAGAAHVHLIGLFGALYRITLGIDPGDHGALDSIASLGPHDRMAMEDRNARAPERAAIGEPVAYEIGGGEQHGREVRQCRWAWHRRQLGQRHDLDAGAREL